MLAPEQIMFVRFLFDALLFAPFVFLKNGWHIPKIDRLLAYALISIPLVVFFSVCLLDQIIWQSIEIKMYLGLIYLSIFTTLGSFFVLQYSTVKLGATKVSVYGFLTPVFVIILSVGIGLEALDWMTLPGMGLVLLSMFLIQKA
ncbi:MAG: drug/metabolite transporter (DMT)-like permease [Oleiphilaceae bacterium]